MMFKWCYNIFLISLLVSDIKKMKKSSPSIYRDVHALLHMLCSHFSNFTFWFNLPSSTSYIIFAFPEQCTWWSGHQKSYRCSKHWSLHQALNLMVLDLHRRILCCMPSILIFCNKVRWWEPRKRSKDCRLKKQTIFLFLLIKCLIFNQIFSGILSLHIFVENI